MHIEVTVDLADGDAARRRGARHRRGWFPCGQGWGLGGWLPNPKWVDSKLEVLSRQQKDATMVVESGAAGGSCCTDGKQEGERRAVGLKIDKDMYNGGDVSLPLQMPRQIFA